MSPDPYDSAVQPTDERSRISRRTIAANAGLLTLGIAISILAAEGLVRVSGVAPEPGLFTVTAQEFERIPGIFGPGQTVIAAKGTPFESSVRINDLGYRGNDFPLVKPAGEFRVLYVGDSFTWGHNVADDETLPAQLEAVLRSSCRGVRDVRVVNAGLSGSTIDGQDEMMRRGLRVQPDLAILMYHENDIDELIHSRIWSQLAANRRIKSRFPLSFVYPVVRRTALWNLAQHARRLREPYVPQGADDPQPMAETSPEVTAARAEYAQRLAAVADTLAEREVPFAFVLFPHPASVRARRGGRDHDWVARTASANGIITIDLLGPIVESGMTVEEAFLVPDDYHPSAAGHRLAAAHLATRLPEVGGAPVCADRTG